jgi:putative sterol carrier protein
MGLADGKVNGQKAFMTGALKVKGNVMLAVSARVITCCTVYRVCGATS